MAIRHVIDLPQASIEIEERAGYLFVVETGQLRSLAELGVYTRRMDEIVARSRVDKAVIDARGEVGDPPPDVRQAMWEWLLAPERGFTTVAFVLPSEMAVARVNMTALARRAPIRAFESVQQAQRWLMRSTRVTASLSEVVVGKDRAPSSRPPARPVSSRDALAPTDRPPSGRDVEETRVPSAPALPRESRRQSDPGFRRPAPGGSEVAEGARTKLRAPADRPLRESELRSRHPKKNGGENGGGSQVA